MVAEIIMTEQHALDTVAVAQEIAVVRRTEAVATRFIGVAAHDRAVVEGDQLAGAVEHERLTGGVGDRLERRAEDRIGRSARRQPVEGYIVDSGWDACVGNNGKAIAPEIGNILRPRRAGRLAQERRVGGGDEPSRGRQPILVVVVDVQRYVAAIVVEVLA